jgi:hypothetical protein
LSGGRAAELQFLNRISVKKQKRGEYIMALLHRRAVLELEVLEDRCAPAVITSGVIPAVSAQLANSAASALSSGVTSSLGGVNTGAAAASGGTSLAAQAGLPAANTLGAANGLPTPTTVGPPVPINTLASAPGTVPVNNTNPNAVTIQFGLPNLGSLSPFVSTFNLGYFQTGPFYTGTTGGAGPNIAPSGSQSNPLSTEGTIPTSTEAPVDLSSLTLVVDVGWPTTLPG